MRIILIPHIPFSVSHFYRCAARLQYLHGIFHRYIFMALILILPWYTFHIITFLLHIHITIFLLLRYIGWHFSNSEYSSFYYIFLDIFLLLRISLFQIYLTLPFHYLCLQLVFSHSPFTALHLISAVFKSFSIPQLPYLMKD